MKVHNVKVVHYAVHIHVYSSYLKLNYAVLMTPTTCYDVCV